MTIQPWERQPGESSQAFQAFAAYRDLGEERSLSAVSQQLHKSKVLLGRWSSRWNWVSRVEAYEREQDRQRLKQQEKDRREMLDRHASIAHGLLSTVAARLKEILKNQEIVKMRPAEMARVTEVAAKVERLARGLPSEQVQHQGAVHHEHDIDERILTDPKARQLAAELLYAIAGGENEAGPAESSGAGDVSQSGEVAPGEASSPAEPANP